MSDAATALHHPAVEPAESPLTPESWGKLGMWIFLAGDAVGFGVLLAAYGAMRADQRRLAQPGPGPRHQPHRPDDVPADLLERHDGEGARVAWAGANRARAKMFVLLTALGGAIFVGLQAYEWTHLIQRGLHINGNPWGATLFGTLLPHHGLPRPPRDRRRDLSPADLPAWSAGVPDLRLQLHGQEIAGLYWHFVDLVWIMVFTFMYLL